jgi:hypothetical protein
MKRKLALFGKLALLAWLVAVPSWASEEIGRQEDSASADGQVLMPIGCVRQDTIGSSTGTDGDYGNVKCNNVGRLYTSGAIDTALPAGTNGIGKLTANGGVIIGDVNLVSAIPVGTNAIGSVSITSLTPGTGATRSGKGEGLAHTDGDTGTMALCVRHDTSTTGLGADGTYAACGLNASGELYTTANTELPAAAALADNTANPTVPGVAAFMMCFDGTNWDRCLPGLSDTDDNSVAFSQVTSIVISQNYVSNGTSWVRQQPDPCDGASKIAVPINIATATTTQLVAASASNSVYICSLNIGPTAGAQNIALIEDDTAACASPTAGMAGGITAASGWNLPANGTVTIGSGTATVAKTAATNRYVCLISSAATQTSGVLMYALAP